ncbi:MAG: enoyl-CoA hydratase/isomerase family protein [Desulfobacteraceae bacterium]|nr:enoyl-CoA hydratase/isomerase family protein [Desulfobacteraceae bacterium]
MIYKNIKIIEGKDFVAELILNRPEHLNTLNTTCAIELDHALNRLDENASVRVILLKGAGKAFCAGIDLKEFEGQSVMSYQLWAQRMQQPLITISRMRKPVIAQVQGAAVANGTGLAAASDIIIAAENAKFGLTAIKAGLNCVGPVVPVARCIGPKKALEWLLYGDLIKAAQAFEAGLVNRVVPNDQLDEQARQWARTLAQKSPLAVQIAKKAFYEAADLPYEKAFGFMTEVFARLCSTEDAHEGVNAFTEKRAPVWKQR